MNAVASSSSQPVRVQSNGNGAAHTSDSSTSNSEIPQGATGSNGFVFPETIKPGQHEDDSEVGVAGSSKAAGVVMEQDPRTIPALNVCASIWQTGFQQGRYSDIQVLVRDRSYHLHRLLLSRSPYLARLMDVRPLHEPLRIEVDDDDISDEAIAICLGHLYGPYSNTTLPPLHAQSILLASNLFVLPDLGSIAYDICRSSISPKTIRPWISWCDAREKHDLLHVKSHESERNKDGEGQESGQGGLGGMASYINGSLASAMGLSTRLNGQGSGDGSGVGSGSVTPSERSIKVGPAWMGEVEVAQQDDWVARLRVDIKKYLVHGYASDLEHQSPVPHDGPLITHPELVATFTMIPFELFKSLLEDGSFAILGSDQERFGFAKKMIVTRRKRALANASAASGSGAKAQVPVENVVLRFGGGTGSSVHVTRKTQARTLWKVEKDA